MEMVVQNLGCSHLGLALDEAFLVWLCGFSRCVSFPAGVYEHRVLTLLAAH